MHRKPSLLSTIMAKNFCYGQDMFVKKKNIDANLVTFPNYLNSLMIILFSTDFKTLKSLYYMKG